MRKTIIIILLLTLVSCNKKCEEFKQGKHVKFPDKLFGINFCNLKLQRIYTILRKNNRTYIGYDFDSKEIKNLTEKHFSKNLVFFITSPYFIGNGLDQSKINQVYYSYMPHMDEFQFLLTMKSEYYNEILRSLSEKFGYENAYVNTKGYGEISWEAHPAMSVRTCISMIILSKKQRYDASENPGKYCYLLIITRGENPYVH